MIIIEHSFAADSQLYSHTSLQSQPADMLSPLALLQSVPVLCNITELVQETYQ